MRVLANGHDLGGWTLIRGRTMASVTLATVKRVVPVGLTGQNANHCSAEIPR